MKSDNVEKIDVTIEYARYDGSNLDDIEKIAGGNIRTIPIRLPYGKIHILTWAGWVPLLERDYIVLINDVLDVWSSNRFESLISAKERRSIE